MGEVKQVRPAPATVRDLRPYRPRHAAATLVAMASGPGARRPDGPARLPPRWFVVAFWHVHRAVLRATGGRLGLWRPKPGGWGTLRLTTTGRRSGEPRHVVVGYIEDGPDLVTMAMNGWAPAEPAWWLNLQAHPDAVARTRDGTRAVRGRRAQGAERERLWARWAEIDRNLDGYAARRPRETAVVVLEPTDGG
jgi:deazaflavin-dependent oxidoreductase (nitroreductase family)